jgi:A/G-specific adenine glycosylase
MKKASLTRFRRKLLAWFAGSRRDLPWRRSKDPYRIWLSEVMLQQTRVAAAIPYYERFLEHFPDVQTLANAPEEEVLRLWAGLGYYSRARNLQKAARQIVAEHNSQFPATRDEALRLAGIGEYTAAAILSIAYRRKLAVLDGNVARVLARLHALRGDLRSNGRWQQLQTLADSLVPSHAPGDWNEAMMELGATICTPRSPQCLLCPVAEFCQARRVGLTDVIPEKRKKRATVEVTLAALVLVDAKGDTLLLSPSLHSPRSSKGHDVSGLLSRMWHFPTTAVERDPERELRIYARDHVIQSLPSRVKFLALSPVHHVVTHRQITLFPFRVELNELPDLPGAKKLSLHKLGSVPISNLMRKVANTALSSVEVLRRNSFEATSLRF